MCGDTRQGKIMLELERPGDLAQYVGKEIGVSDWFTVDQAIIDKFADATGDHQWIHVDAGRQDDRPRLSDVVTGATPRTDDLPRQASLARPQLWLEPNPVHRAGAGRIADTIAPEDQIRRPGRGRRAHHLGKHR